MPITSISGNNYLFIMYDYDSNYIDTIQIPSRTKLQVLKAYEKSYAMFKSRVLIPLLQRLDNKASGILKAYMHKENVDFQLTPSGIHRRNTAERLIQTFKAHLIAGLCTVDPKSPLNLWDKLIQQAILTLDLLRPSNTNPHLSAYVHVHGSFDYNRTPLLPPGIKVLAHIRSDENASWAPHAIHSFYIGPIMDHYRCHKIWTLTPNLARISETVKWFPHNFKIPTASRESLILAVANDLIQVLQRTQDDPGLAPVSPSTTKILTKLVREGIWMVSM